MKKYRTEIVIERKQRLFISSRKMTRGWCTDCAGTVNWMRPGEAAIVTGISSREIYRLVEAGQIHFQETVTGCPQVCCNSLTETPATARAEARPQAEPSQAPKIKRKLPAFKPEPSAGTTSARVRRRYRADRTELDGEAFGRLLTVLDANWDEAGEKYLLLRQKLKMFFECRGCQAAGELADETINRVALRVKRGEEIHSGEPLPYFYGVARNVLREYSGCCERFFLPLEDTYPVLMRTDDPLRLAEQEHRRLEQDRMLESLEECLRELPPETRHLLLEYHRCERGCDRIRCRRELAERMGISVNALKIRVHRIRELLERQVLARLSPDTEPRLPGTVSKCLSEITNREAVA